MLRLARTLNAWGQPDFKDTLKQEIEQLGSAQLPLQQGLSVSSYALDDKLDAVILDSTEDEGFLQIKAGLFYTGIIAGCSCADDPTRVDEQGEYCEVQIEINKLTAETTVVLLAA